MSNLFGRNSSNISFLKGIVFYKKAYKVLTDSSNFGIFAETNYDESLYVVKDARDFMNATAYVYVSMFVRRRLVKDCPLFKPVIAGSTFYYVDALQDFLSINFKRINFYFTFNIRQVKCGHLFFEYNFFMSQVLLPLKVISKNPGLVAILPLKIWLSIIRQIQYVLLRGKN